MSNISKNGIVTLTKGDTFQLPLFINSGTEFDPVAFDFQEGDKVLLRLMRANESFNDAVLKKTFEYGGENEDSYIDDEGNVVFKFSYFDTYWQSEGWGEHANEPYYNEVCAIEYNEEDNSVELS